MASLCYHKGCCIRLEVEWEGDKVALMETCRPWVSNQGHTEYNAYTLPFHWTSVPDVKSFFGVHRLAVLLQADCDTSRHKL